MSEFRTALCDLTRKIARNSTSGARFWAETETWSVLTKKTQKQLPAVISEVTVVTFPARAVHFDWVLCQNDWI